MPSVVVCGLCSQVVMDSSVALDASYIELLFNMARPDSDRDQLPTKSCVNCYKALSATRAFMEKYLQTKARHAEYVLHGMVILGMPESNSSGNTSRTNATTTTKNNSSTELEVVIKEEELEPGTEVESEAGIQDDSDPLHLPAKRMFLSLKKSALPKKQFYFESRSGRQLEEAKIRNILERNLEQHVEDQELQEVLPSNMPLKCQLCLEIQPSKEEFLAHLEALHGDVIHDDTLELLREDIRKSKLKKKAESMKDSAVNEQVGQANPVQDEASNANPSVQALSSLLKPVQDAALNASLWRI